MPQSPGCAAGRMATLADTFLADLEDLSDASEREEEPAREDAADHEVGAQAPALLPVQGTI